MTTWALNRGVISPPPPAFFFFPGEFEKEGDFLQFRVKRHLLGRISQSIMSPAPVQSGSMRLRLRILFFLRLLSGGKIESSISSAKVFTCNFGDSFPYCAHFMIYILLCIFLSNLASEGRLHIHTQECIQCTYSLCPRLLPSWGRSSELHC